MGSISSCAISMGVSAEGVISSLTLPAATASAAASRVGSAMALAAAMLCSTASISSGCGVDTSSISFASASSSSASASSTKVSDVTFSCVGGVYSGGVSMSTSCCGGSSFCIPAAISIGVSAAKACASAFIVSRSMVFAFSALNDLNSSITLTQRDMRASATAVDWMGNFKAAAPS